MESATLWKVDATEAALRSTSRGRLCSEHSVVEAFQLNEASPTGPLRFPRRKQQRDSECPDLHVIGTSSRDLVVAAAQHATYQAKKYAR